MTLIVTLSCSYLDGGGGWESERDGSPRPLRLLRLNHYSCFPSLNNVEQKSEFKRNEATGHTTACKGVDLNVIALWCTVCAASLRPLCWSTKWLLRKRGPEGRSMAPVVTAWSFEPNKETVVVGQVVAKAAIGREHLSPGSKRLDAELAKSELRP